MPQTTPGGASIPNGVNPAAFDAGEVFYLAGQAETPGFTDLTPAEIARFERDLRRLSYMQALERDLSSILLSQRDSFLYAAAIAKAQFKGVSFGGLLGGGFNMQLIRSIGILGNVPVAQGGGGGTAVLTWARAFTTTGWQAIFGNFANPVPLGTTGAATTALTTYDRLMFAAPYIVSRGPGTPLLQEIRARVQQTDYAIYPLTWMPITNMYIAKLPGTLLLLLNQTFAIEGNIQPTGQDEIMLLGLQYVTHDYSVLTV